MMCGKQLDSTKILYLFSVELQFAIYLLLFHTRKPSSQFTDWKFKRIAYSSRNDHGNRKTMEKWNFLSLRSQAKSCFVYQ